MELAQILRALQCIFLCWPCSTLRTRQVFDPCKRSKDVGIAAKIIFPQSDTKEVAALFVPHARLMRFAKRES
jgi:hypothetical protein